jgi:phosphoribosylamine--glycine ligase
MYSSINHFIFNSLLSKINFTKSIHSKSLFCRHRTNHACDVIYECELYTNFIVFVVFHFAYSQEERVAVLVIGGGGREHALCHALQRSPSCDTVFCAPGNAGIASSGNATCISDLDVYDGAAVELFCRKWRVGLVVVGPESPLVAGLSNYLVKAGITTFGPSAEAAALEGSKNFMKHLCDKYDIPTAKVCVFLF